MTRTSDKSVVLIQCLICRSHQGFLISEDPTAISIDVTCRSQRHQQTPDDLNIRIPPSLVVGLRKQTHRGTQENVTSIGDLDEKQLLVHALLFSFLQKENISVLFFSQNISNVLRAVCQKQKIHEHQKFHTYNRRDLPIFLRTIFLIYFSFLIFIISVSKCCTSDMVVIFAIGLYCRWHGSTIWITTYTWYISFARSLSLLAQGTRQEGTVWFSSSIGTSLSALLGHCVPYSDFVTPVGQILITGLLTCSS